MESEVNDKLLKTVICELGVQIEVASGKEKLLKPRQVGAMMSFITMCSSLKDFGAKRLFKARLFVA